MQESHKALQCLRRFIDKDYIIPAYVLSEYIQRLYLKTDRLNGMADYETSTSTQVEAKYLRDYLKPLVRQTIGASHCTDAFEMALFWFDQVHTTDIKSEANTFLRLIDDLRKQIIAIDESRLEQRLGEISM